MLKGVTDLIKDPNGPYPPLFSSSFVGIHLPVFFSNFTARLVELPLVREAGVPEEIGENVEKACTPVEVMYTKKSERIATEFILQLSFLVPVCECVGCLLFIVPLGLNSEIDGNENTSLKK